MRVRLAAIAAATLALVLPASAAERPRFGGDLRVLIPATPALDLDRFDPAEARTPLDLVLARSTCEPLLAEGPAGVQQRLLFPPDGDPRARLLTLRLRPGLRFADGAPLRTRDVVESLQRLETALSPMRALLLPLGGGTGLTAHSDTEVAATFDFPYPDWPLALAHPAACPVQTAHGRLVGRSGPFVPQGKVAPPAARLDANAEAPTGRAFADHLSLRTSNRANAARSLASGGADVSLVPVADSSALAGPISVATYLVVNPHRPGLAEVPSHLSASLDRAELVRTYVHPPSVPLYGLLAPSVELHPVSAPPLADPVRLATPASGELLVEFGQDEQRAVADRLQVKLHDLGIDMNVVAVSRDDLAGRLARGDYDLALATVPALPEAGLDLAEVLLIAGQVDVARTELKSIGAVPDAAGRREQASARARALLASVPIVPLYAQGMSLVARPAVLGLRFDRSGAFDVGDVWLQDAR